MHASNKREMHRNSDDMCHLILIALILRNPNKSLSNYFNKLRNIERTDNAKCQFEYKYT